MSSYKSVKGGKLKLKGEKKHKKSTKRKLDRESKLEGKYKNEETQIRGGWWKITTANEITGSIAVEFGARTYIHAMDTGGFTLGDLHESGEGPDQSEQLVVFRIDDDKIAFKTGYGKYVGVQNDGQVIARADAIGLREQWQVVTEDGKTALLNNNGRFLSVTEDDSVYCAAFKAEKDCFITLRSSNQPVGELDDDVPKEERGSLKSTELNYVKKYQSFQDRKLLLSKKPKVELKRARAEGDLHESLLDRREKMKSDKYCK